MLPRFCGNLLNLDAFSYYCCFTKIFFQVHRGIPRNYQMGSEDEIVLVIFHSRLSNINFWCSSYKHLNKEIRTIIENKYGQEFIDDLKKRTVNLKNFFKEKFF